VATVDDIEHTDSLVFDLDPGERVPWDFVIETALRMRDLLEHEGFKPWPKVTGGRPARDGSVGRKADP
jgi:bifunctional non-homologous end joining protein LigD